MTKTITELQEHATELKAQAVQEFAWLVMATHKRWQRLEALALILGEPHYAAMVSECHFLGEGLATMLAHPGVPQPEGGFVRETDQEDNTGDGSPDTGKVPMAWRAMPERGKQGAS